MLEIVPDEVLSMLRRAVLDDQVSGSTNSNLVGNMPWQDELTVIPADFNLMAVSKGLFSRMFSCYVPSFHGRRGHDA